MIDNSPDPAIPQFIAKLWVGFALVSLVILLVFSSSTYFEFDALGIWILSGIAILYLSRKKIEYLDKNAKIWIVILGAAIIILGLVSIPIGFTHPPFSIGEYSIILSGVGIIIFGLYGLRSYLLPVSLPFIAIAGYSGYEVFLRNQDWLVSPLVPVTTSISVGLLNFLGIGTVVEDNVFTFISRSGDPISLTIVSDCTGIMSLGTFTIAAIIVLSSFPKSITRRSIWWLILGYVGTYCANIVRIVLIALSGYYFGPVGVIEQVHVNIGWIIFSGWMIIFWYYFFTRVIGVSFFKKNNN
jgi:exosortase